MPPGSGRFLGRPRLGKDLQSEHITQTIGLLQTGCLHGWSRMPASRKKKPDAIFFTEIPCPAPQSSLH